MLHKQVARERAKQRNQSRQKRRAAEADGVEHETTDDAVRLLNRIAIKEIDDVKEALRQAGDKQATLLNRMAFLEAQVLQQQVNYVQNSCFCSSSWSQFCLS